MFLTVQQRTNLAGFPKPGELIEITGAHNLEASDRAIWNLLYQHAHDAGNITDPDAEWKIPLSRLRVASDKHKSRIKDSLGRLMNTHVEVGYIDAETGQVGFLLTPLFEFFWIPKDERRTGAFVKYGLPRKLRPLIARSSRWGRVRTEVVRAMFSRYAMALYELIQLRAHRDNALETFTPERFRALMGVPPGSYERGNNFLARVVEPAVAEVSRLGDMGVAVALKRASPRAPITDITVTWWRKDATEFRDAQRRLAVPKRAARSKDSRT